MVALIKRCVAGLPSSRGVPSRTTRSLPTSRPRPPRLRPARRPAAGAAGDAAARQPAAAAQRQPVGGHAGHAHGGRQGEGGGHVCRGGGVVVGWGSRGRAWVGECERAVAAPCSDGQQPSVRRAAMRCCGSSSCLQALPPGPCAGRIAAATAASRAGPHIPAPSVPCCAADTLRCAVLCRAPPLPASMRSCQRRLPPRRRAQLGRRAGAAARGRRAARRLLLRLLRPSSPRGLSGA